MYWYVGVVVAFTILTRGTKTVLKKWIGKTTLKTLNLVKLQKLYIFYYLRKLDTVLPYTERIYINKTFVYSYRNRFNGWYARSFIYKLNKRVIIFLIETTHYVNETICNFRQAIIFQRRKRLLIIHSAYYLFHFVATYPTVESIKLFKRFIPHFTMTG